MSSSAGVITILTLALPVVTLCYPDQWPHQIYVDNQTGVNNSSCWEGGYSIPCLSLNLALTGAQHYNNSTTIILQPGHHQLHSGSETQLRNMSQLAIVGNGSQGEVVIRCDPLAGLAFFWLQGIELRNISLVACGAPQSSISKPAADGYPQIRVAIFFANCNATKLTNVHITSSVGTGAVVYNPVGVVNITSCLFSLSGDQGGGEGLVIEVNKITSKLSCIITNSSFTHNIGNFNPVGRGISVMFSENAAYNVVQLDGVHIENNDGSGILLTFKDNAYGNTVQLDGACIENNGRSGISLAFEDNTNKNTVELGGIQIENNDESGIVLTFKDSTNGNIVQLNTAVCIENNDDSGILLVFEDSTSSNTVKLGGVQIQKNDGSGILLKFKHITNGNIVQLSGVQIKNNDGSGILMEFERITNGNTVQLGGIQVENNEESGILLTFKDNTFGNAVKLGGVYREQRWEWYLTGIHRHYSW